MGQKRTIPGGARAAAELLDKDGRVTFDAADEQTTVGAAGAAAAPPLNPTKYLKVVASDGTVLVIPAYAAA